MPKITKKEVIIAAAAIGVAVIVWNYRDRISALFFWRCSSGASQSVSATDLAKSASDAQAAQVPKTTDASPNASPKMSAEKTDGAGTASSEKEKSKDNAGDAAGNTAPEAMDTPKDMAPSTYVGLPKSDPSTVSSSVAPS